jgi:hypothetical protein
MCKVKFYESCVVDVWREWSNDQTTCHRVGTSTIPAVGKTPFERALV